jgi:hypothetical protein
MSLLHIHVHAASPCPCCMCPFCMSNCPCPCLMFKTTLNVHANAVCLHPCCMSIPTQDMDTDTDMNRDRGTDDWKRIFWSELKQIEATFSFLGSLCFEANILKQIFWSEYFEANWSELKRIF